MTSASSTIELSGLPWVWCVTIRFSARYPRWSSIWRNESRGIGNVEKALMDRLGAPVGGKKRTMREHCCPPKSRATHQAIQERTQLRMRGRRISHVLLSPLWGSFGSALEGAGWRLSPYSRYFFSTLYFVSGYAQVAMVGNMRRSPLSNQLFEVIVCCPTAKMNTKENI